MEHAEYKSGGLVPQFKDVPQPWKFRPSCLPCPADRSRARRHRGNHGAVRRDTDRAFCDAYGKQFLFPPRFARNRYRVRQIQALVRNGLYYLMEHAYHEAAEDDFDIHDVGQGILTGRIRRSWPRDGKYEPVGSALDGRSIGVVCRITMSGKVRVIAVYEDNPRG